MRGWQAPWSGRDFTPVYFGRTGARVHGFAAADGRHILDLCRLSRHVIHWNRSNLCLNCPSRPSLPPDRTLKAGSSARDCPKALLLPDGRGRHACASITSDPRKTPNRTIVHRRFWSSGSTETATRIGMLFPCHQVRREIVEIAEEGVLHRYLARRAVIAY